MKNLKFTIEAAEKIADGNQFVSGDTIKWSTAKTLIEAKRKAEAMIKSKNIISVWIHSFDSELLHEDPLCQWVKYEDENWKVNKAW